MEAPLSNSNQPEGFTWQATGDGVVFIHHHRRLAKTLKGKDAAKFQLFAETANEEQLQHRMARLTGHYKH